MTTTYPTPTRIACPSWCAEGEQRHLDELEDLGWISHTSTELATMQPADTVAMTVTASFGTDPTGKPGTAFLEINDDSLSPAEARKLIAALQTGLAMLAEVGAV